MRIEDGQSQALLYKDLRLVGQHIAGFEDRIDAVHIVQAQINTATQFLIALGGARVSSIDSIHNNAMIATLAYHERKPDREPFIDIVFSSINSQIPAQVYTHAVYPFDTIRCCDPPSRNIRYWEEHASNGSVRSTTTIIPSGYDEMKNPIPDIGCSINPDGSMKLTVRPPHSASIKSLTPPQLKTFAFQEIPLLLRQAYVYYKSIVGKSVQPEDIYVHEKHSHSFLYTRQLSIMTSPPPDYSILREAIEIGDILRQDSRSKYAYPFFFYRNAPIFPGASMEYRSTPDPITSFPPDFDAPRGPLDFDDEPED